MNLTQKLTLAFVLVSLVVIGLVAALIWGGVSYEFNRYLQDQRQNEFIIAVSTYYDSYHSWAGIDTYLRTQGLLPPLSESNPPPQPYVLVGTDRQIIVASPPFMVGEKIKKGEIEKGIPIINNGQAVGTVISTGQPLTRKPIDQKYADQIKQAFWVAGIIGIAVAIIIGLLLARSLTRPVHDLTQATREMAQGKLEQKVAIRSKDELGELAQTFNQMSADLARANRSRRQMTADIAHDLRNPLTVIGGYLESFQEGKLKPTSERFASMQAEVRNMQRLIEDLRILSLADAGELVLNCQIIYVPDLLEHVSEAYQNLAVQKNVSLKVEVEQDLPQASLDLERMEQVLANLISNAFRYTPEGGIISLSAEQAEGHLIISVIDNGSGIPAEILPYVFERSYRGDPSRSGDGSGLGLAIAKSIVELHGGQIGVKSEVGSGSHFWIKFPIKKCS